MYVISLKELRFKLSDVIKKVKSGRKVIITERGKPVAEINRIRPSNELAGMLAGLKIDLKKEKEERLKKYEDKGSG